MAAGLPFDPWEGQTVYLLVDPAMIPPEVDLMRALEGSIAAGKSRAPVRDSPDLPTGDGDEG